MKIKSKRINKIVIIILILGFTLVMSGLYFVKKHDSKKGTPPVVTQQEPVNLAPPTQEDAQRVADNKQRIIDQQNQTQTQPGTKKTVKPTITYASQYGQSIEVGSYVTGVFEDGSTCTATFTLGSNSFKKSVKGVKSANSVNCPVISASISEFTQKGTWSVTISYESVSASGTSDSRQVEVK